MNYISRRKLTYGLFAFPALLFLCLQIWPLGEALRSSFTNASGHLTTQNFRDIFSDSLYREALRNNLVIPVFSVLLETFIGVGMALGFYSLRRGKTLWRTVAIVPYAVPEIVYILTMKLVFREHGYLNSLLFSVVGGGDLVNWFQPGRVLTIAMIILIDAWRVTPVVFLIVLVALEQLPESFLDAAKVDGATWWQVARFIQIPLIIPALLIAVALRAIDAFRIFATPLILVGVEGLPVITSVAYHYKVDANNPAQANAAALSLAFFLVLATVAAFLFVGRRANRK